MFEEFKKYLREDACLCAFLVIGVCLIGFAGSNWYSYTRPNYPTPTALEKPEMYAIRVDKYNRDMEDVGKDTIIPFPVAVSLTFLGIAGALIPGLILIKRHG